LTLVYLPHSDFLDLGEATEKLWRVNGQRLESESGLFQVTSSDHLGPGAPDQFEILERGYGVRAIVGLKDLREENMRFLAPGAHKFLEVRKGLKYGMNAGGSDELADARTLRAGFESGTEQGDEGEARRRDLQRV